MSGDPGPTSEPDVQGALGSLHIHLCVYMQGHVDVPDRPDVCLVAGDNSPLRGRNTGEVSPNGSPRTTKGPEASTLSMRRREPHRAWNLMDKKLCDLRIFLHGHKGHG